MPEALTHNYNSDINEIEMCDELVALCELIAEKTEPIKVLEYIAVNNITPNVSIALRILLRGCP